MLIDLINQFSVDQLNSSSGPSDELGKDAFLQLLVTQMRYQDPLDPMKNEDFIAQLAQFSTLEQMTNLNDSFEELSQRMEFLIGNVDQLNFISAQGLLGKYVEGIDLSGNLMSGTVESVTLDGSIVVLTVDGEYMPMTGVLAIAPEAPVESPSEEKTSGTGLEE